MVVDSLSSAAKVFDCVISASVSLKYVPAVSSVFRLADCTLEKQLSTRKLALGLVSAGSNGFEPKGRFLQIRR